MNLNLISNINNICTSPENGKSSFYNNNNNNNNAAHAIFPSSISGGGSASVIKPARLGYKDGLQ